MVPQLRLTASHQRHHHHHHHRAAARTQSRCTATHHPYSRVWESRLCWFYPDASAITKTHLVRNCRRGSARHYFNVVSKDKKDVKGQSRNKPLFEAWAVWFLKEHTKRQQRQRMRFDKCVCREEVRTQTNSCSSRSLCCSSAFREVDENSSVRPPHLYLPPHSLTMCLGRCK